MADKVRILDGEYEGYIGTLVDDDGDTATVQIGDEEHEGDTIEIPSGDVEPFASISKLFDDPEDVEED